MADTPMADIRDTLADWLRDAHAMETQAVQMLERQAERIRNYPDILAKVKEHLEVSRHQAERVKTCLQALGTETSSIKTGIGMLMGNAQSLSGIPAGDEIVKAAIFNDAFERFEIANYRALITTAELAGETEIARLCRESLAEEEEMARWIEQRLPALTRTYLERSVTAPSEAKR